jgi:hypothetical protein
MDGVNLLKMRMFGVGPQSRHVGVDNYSQSQDFDDDGQSRRQRRGGWNGGRSQASNNGDVKNKNQYKNGKRGDANGYTNINRGGRNRGVINMDDDDDDNNSDTYGDGSGDQQGNGVIDLSISEKLPSVQRLKNIIDRLRSFNVLKALPSDTKYVKEDVDTLIEKNLEKLFSQALFDDRFILEALVKIVRKEDDLMTSRQKINIKKDVSMLTTAQKNALTAFYPNLMGLIKALLTHCDKQDRAVHPTDIPGTVKQMIIRIWKDVMADLNELRYVIVYASGEGLITLGDFPTEWNKTISDRNMKISNLKTEIHKLTEQRIQLQQELNERDHKIEEIRSEYADRDTQLQLVQSDIQNRDKTLETYTDVRVMLNANLERIDSQSTAGL